MEAQSLLLVLISAGGTLYVSHERERLAQPIMVAATVGVLLVAILSVRA